MYPPAERTISLWTKHPSPGFTVHVKAFRLLTQHPTASDALWTDLRQALARIRGRQRPHPCPAPNPAPGLARSAKGPGHHPQLFRWRLKKLNTFSQPSIAGPGRYIGVW